ncbi:MAG: NAD(P)/FAD-dependent oxidoreductase [Candidatus Nanosyncoccaceae bacterium]|jgi:thioredoxin reductase (NADPH)
MDKIWDLIIVGAGPAGLSAALYAARDEHEVLILERGVVGGNVAATEKLDNYPGFPDGVTGLELGERMKKQAQKYGAKLAMAQVEKLKLDSDIKEITVDGGDKLRAKTILLATGTTYRKLGVTGEAEMLGRGVHFCATCDAAFYKDKKVVVIGGGNSAVEESGYIAKYAKEIDLIARGELTATKTVIKEMQPLVESGKITVHTFEDTTEIMSKDGVVTGVKTVNLKSKKETEWPADGVFVFIGQIPNTDFLKDSGVKLCEMGYVLTEDNKTNLSGVFAAGDVCAWATQQAVVAAGDGVKAALAINQYLQYNNNK